MQLLFCKYNYWITRSFRLSLYRNPVFIFLCCVCYFSKYVYTNSNAKVWQILIYNREWLDAQENPRDSAFYESYRITERERGELRHTREFYESSPRLSSMSEGRMIFPRGKDQEMASLSLSLSTDATQSRTFPRTRETLRPWAVVHTRRGFYSSAYRPALWNRYANYNNAT